MTAATDETQRKVLFAAAIQGLLASNQVVKVVTTADPVNPNSPGAERTHSTRVNGVDALCRVAKLIATKALAAYKAT